MPRTTRANNKTQPNERDVVAYLNAIEHAGRREDAFVLLDLMRDAAGEEARMWGDSIVGFGEYHYVYDSGREGNHMLTGFAPRKANMVVYVMPGFTRYARLLDKLGRYKTGSSCLYLGRLSGVDLEVLHKLVAASVQDMRRKYAV